MMDYSERLEALAAEYGPKALALLGRARDVLIAAGLDVTEPFDMSSDDYTWSIVVRPTGDTNDNNIVDVSVEIAEQRAYEGGDGWGVNFGIDIVKYGGQILGGLMPYNFTQFVWVDCRVEDAVAARWQILEESNLDTLPSLIKEEL